MDFRVVVSDPKSGKAYQVELKDPGASKLLGKRIGDKIEGDVLGMPGYSVQVTGGSDREGVSHSRSDLPRHEAQKDTALVRSRISSNSRRQKEADEHSWQRDLSRYWADKRQDRGGRHKAC